MTYGNRTVSFALCCTRTEQDLYMNELLMFVLVPISYPSLPSHQESAGKSSETDPAQGRL